MDQYSLPSPGVDGDDVLTTSSAVGLTRAVVLALALTWVVQLHIVDKCVGLELSYVSVEACPFSRGLQLRTQLSLNVSEPVSASLRCTSSGTL